MNRLLNNDIINFNCARIKSLIENFLQKKIEHYTSLYALSYLSNYDDNIITNTKYTIRRELKHYLIKLFKQNSHLFSLEYSSSLTNIAEQISLSFEDIIKEKLEHNIVYMQKYLSKNKISEALP